MVTTPKGIWSPDSGDGYELTQDLAAMATSIDNALPPTGSIIMFAGPVTPAGWLKCDGASVSQTTYAALYAVVGSAYGTPAAPGQFRVPTMLGRVPVGMTLGQTEFSSLGKAGGSKTNTHNHFQTGGGDNGNFFSRSYQDAPRTRTGSGWRAALSGLWAQATYRENSTHNETIDILPPYLSLNFLIKT